MNIDHQSFQLVSEGRGGKILYQELSHELELDWEIANSSSPSDIIILGGFDKWKTPSQVPVPLSKQIEILEKLRTWLKQNNHKSNIDIPLSMKEINAECSWVGCKKPCIGDLKICLYHYNLSCLGHETT